MKHSTWMAVAETIAKGESKCISRQVCAIIVQNDRLKSTGHNGTPPGQPNCCDVNAHLLNVKGIFKDKDHADRHHKWSLKNEIHAEINAIMYCSPEDRKGATLYSTLEPCADCAKAIAGSGITTVIYKQEYPRTPQDARDILKNANIAVHKLSNLV